MPPIVKRSSTTETGAPTLRGSTIWDTIQDLSAALGGFPPAEIARALLLGDREPSGPGLMPMTTMLPGKLAESIAERVPAAQDLSRALTPRTLRGQALGSLANTMEPAEAAGTYRLKEPTVERLADVYRIGTSMPSTSNWAGSQSDELLRAFEGDEEAALKWARMWGATSPNTSVPVNTRESISALAHSLENPGAEMTIDLARSLPDAKITMAPSKVPNLNAALAGRPLSGDKVEAMAGFMAGKERIPIDVHALYAIGSEADKLDKELPALRKAIISAENLPARGGLSNTGIYLRYEDALKSALREIAPNRHINQVFAELWEGARAHKGLKPQGGPIDILRKKGLLEMGAMLDPERLRAALRSQGWTAGAIAGLMAGLSKEGKE